ncbi:MULTISPECIES: hypothetical protein [Methylobacterium]|uniref:hypothetical protein n=1 Tax=Methylobacterium TaxID=407 RepID=UPI0011CBC952|nr:MULTISPECIES: hypothetical protein [Methylobacterium]TXN22287.1 hypothetical protein FV220_22175 [Methylobacterium sp. WL19]
MDLLGRRGGSLGTKRVTADRHEAGIALASNLPEVDNFPSTRDVGGNLTVESSYWKGKTRPAGIFGNLRLI